MKTVTKAEIAAKASSETGLSISVCEDVVSKLFEAILDSAVSEKHVHIKNFGGFKVFKKKSRPGRDIANNLEVMIESKNVVRFSASKKLRHLLNNKEKSAGSNI